jgi:hypothetical protein
MDKEQIKKLEEFKRAIKNLDTPSKIQDFLNKIPVNFEEDGKETCMSPLSVLQKNKSHCIEGAFFAAACIWLNKIGEGKPLVVDMVGEEGDWDHVIAIFQKDGKFGAISKTNHAVLRYREPVYESIRELVMSYFHEYTDDRGLGRKTLRKYSLPVDLSVFEEEWIISEEDLWHIHDFIDSVKHLDILTKKQIQELRKADDIEIKMGELVEYKHPGKI